MATVTASGSRETSSQATSQSGSNSKKLKIEAQFCPETAADPFDTVEWELRSAQIKHES